MGTFTDNLLKLTEFPFSYSFIGVLVLIAGGKGLLSEEASLANLGPLLILMGFVATILSISDPVGRLQKAWLIGNEKMRVEESTQFRFVVYYKMHLLARLINYLKRERNLPLPPDSLPYLFNAMPIFRALLWRLVMLAKIPIFVVMTLLSNFQDYRNKNFARDLNMASTGFTDYTGDDYADLIDVFSKLGHPTLVRLTAKIVSLKRKTLETTWITREIDKITSMAYFMIVVATFTYAVLFVPNVIDKFVDAFQGTESAQNEQAQESEDAAVRNEHILPSKIIIGAFSFVALGVVLTILIKRARELRSKCLTTFRFLVLQNAIKIKRDTFERRLEEIRQFLVDGDWTLAEVEVDRLMEEYDDLVKKEWDVTKEKEISPEEIRSKDTEKKIMLTWKNGEMRE
ncbi:MAG: hypothetical protein M3299_06330, partial [Thermoproteota archaeon]|nr:hypothetical protein [Thermoproteota archaeon]